MAAHPSAPLGPDVREIIDLWVSDFLDRPAARAVVGALGESASAVLSAFLEAACHGGVKPADVGEHEVAHALLDHVSALSLGSGVHAQVPPLVEAFLGDLEDAGRLADGQSLGARVRVLAPTYRERAAGVGPDLKRPAAKVGRNDPCPCGSGRKYKTCCLRRLE